MYSHWCWYIIVHTSVLSLVLISTPMRVHWCVLLYINKVHFLMTSCTWTNKLLRFLSSARLSKIFVSPLSCCWEWSLSLLLRDIMEAMETVLVPCCSTLIYFLLCAHVTPGIAIFTENRSRSVLIKDPVWKTPCFSMVTIVVDESSTATHCMCGYIGALSILSYSCCTALLMILWTRCLFEMMAKFWGATYALARTVYISTILTHWSTWSRRRLLCMCGLCTFVDIHAWEGVGGENSSQ